MKMELLFFFLFGIASCLAVPQNILLISTPFAGHANRLLALGEELVTRGHNVTFCSLDGWTKVKDRAEDRGMKYLSAGELRQSRSEFMKATTTMFSSTKDNLFAGKLLNIMRDIFCIDRLAEYFTATNLSQWDTVIVEHFLLYSVSCIAKQKNVNVIGISNKVFVEQQQWSFPPSYTGSSHNLSYRERLMNELSNLVVKFKRIIFSVTFHKSVYGTELTDPICQQVFTWYPAEGWEFPLIISTVLSFDYPRMISPLTHYVGPILSQQALTKPLPNDIEEWLQDKEERSVIYISMGSMASISSTLAKAFVDGTINTNYFIIWSLNKQSQHVIADMKLDDRKYYISSWAPQTSILQHKSVSMAICHGGSNGIHEVISFGVPSIVIPHLGDQIDWAVRVEDAGVGIRLLPHQVTSVSIKESINKIESGDYRMKAQKMKLIMRNAGGVKKAADLVEFYGTVGYDHLIPAPVKYKWNWIQYHNIDVYITLLSVALGIIWLMRTICSYCCCSFKRKLKQN